MTLAGRFGELARVLDSHNSMGLFAASAIKLELCLASVSGYRDIHVAARRLSAEQTRHTQSTAEAITAERGMLTSYS